MNGFINQSAYDEFRGECEREIEMNFGRWDLDETPLYDLTDLDYYPADDPSYRVAS